MDNKRLNLIDFIYKTNEYILGKNDNSQNVEENEISELFMHKILFFLYGGFYKNFKKRII